MKQTVVAILLVLTVLNLMAFAGMLAGLGTPNEPAMRTWSAFVVIQGGLTLFLTPSLMRSAIRDDLDRYLLKIDKQRREKQS